MITIDPPGSAQLLTASHIAALTRFLNRARQAVNLVGNIDVLFTSDATLRRLNRTFRGKNKPTDVLSFPAATGHTGPAGHPNNPDHPVAGDLAISLDTAARQAADHGHTVATELRILILHGILHLAGYDHENDSGEMAECEGELRRELRLPTGLIARAEAPAPRRARTAAPAGPETTRTPKPAGRSSPTASSPGMYRSRKQTTEPAPAPEQRRLARRKVAAA